MHAKTLAILIMVIVTSQSLNLHSFDTSIWSDFLDGKLISSLQNASLMSLNHGVRVLSTRLMSQFAECLCRCHDAGWLDQEEQAMVLKPPCGAISAVIASGAYDSTPFVFSWRIQRISSTIINLTIEEFSLPMLSIQCQESHVNIHGVEGDKKNLCGRLPKLFYFSATHMVIEFFAKLLITPAKLCFSYTHGWQYEQQISDNNTLILADSHPPQTIHISKDNIIETKRKFLFGADFLARGIIRLHISSGMTMMDAYNGPGHLSPLLHHIPEDSKFSMDIEFYLYLETSILTHGSNSRKPSNAHIEYESMKYVFRSAT